MNETPSRVPGSPGKSGQRPARRPSWSSILLALAVVVAATVVTAGATIGSNQGGSVAYASSAASPSPSPKPSPSPTIPPLRKPTKSKPLKVYFGGDSLAGLPGILLAQRGKRTGLLRVRTDYQVSSRLTYPLPVNWPARLRAQIDGLHPEVGVFMIGANDPGMPMTVKSKFTTYPQRAWLQEYQRRAEKMMLIMLNRRVARVYWIGMPVMPKETETNQMKRLNKLFRAAAAKHPEVAYIDCFALLATEDGDFIASLRSGDGVHFTTKGAQRIADAVWAAMRRDWSASR